MIITSFESSLNTAQMASPSFESSLDTTQMSNTSFEVSLNATQMSTMGGDIVETVRNDLEF